MLGFENLAKEKEEETDPVISKTSPVGFSPLNTSWFLQQLKTRVSLLKKTVVMELMEEEEVDIFRKSLEVI